MPFAKVCPYLAQFCSVHMTTARHFRFVTYHILCLILEYFCV